MEFLRETVNSDALASIFNLPANMRGKDVEVIILPLKNEQRKKARSKSVSGGLKKYANPALIPEEKGAWERAVIEKYADR